MESSDPKIQKELGRRVRNFDPSVWSDHCDDIVKLANYIKVCSDLTCTITCSHIRTFEYIMVYAPATIMKISNMVYICVCVCVCVCLMLLPKILKVVNRNVTKDLKVTNLIYFGQGTEQM